MAYVVYRYFKTPAKDAVDGKNHRRIQYYAGREMFCGIGIENWRYKDEAKIYDDYKTAVRVASSFRAKVKEI